MSKSIPIRSGQNSKYQKTIKIPFTLSGVGLHSGKPAKLTVRPAAGNSGIIFVSNGKRLPATIDNLKDTRRGTSLNGVAVVEHFLSACAGLGLDNLEAEIDSEELPTMDGSAKPFVEAFLKAGLREQTAAKIFCEIDRPIIIKEKTAFIKAQPYHGFRVDFIINFEGIGKQSFVYEAENTAYQSEIAPARTFGYLEEHEGLKKKGLALGASAENALILSKTGYVNRPRYKDEPVRHKILDLIGDLTLLGGPLHAAITAFCSGHKMNTELVRLLQSSSGG